MTKLTDAHPGVFDTYQYQPPVAQPQGSTVVPEVQEEEVEDDDALTLELKLSVSKQDLKIAGALFAFYMFWKLKQDK